MLGGVLVLTLGYAALGLVHGTPEGMWPALALVIAGHGLFKPNMAALVGALYVPSDPPARSLPFTGAPNTPVGHQPGSIVGTKRGAQRGLCVRF